MTCRQAASLIMKPVSYQSMPSCVNGGHSNLRLNNLLSTGNVFCCEKCGFISSDAAGFKKHMLEHMGTKLYCFYCNSVSFSEAELNEHLKLHTSKYPLKCPHCGHGYMRRRCLVKHIERLHSKNISQGPAKPGLTKNVHAPVSSALTSAPTSDPSPLRPLVRVTLPTPNAPSALIRKNEQKGKTQEINASNSTRGNTELVPPLNGLIQHNRALTVSLPEEVTIPAGCLVELVEVKTVNGTKELKLRLVSQQENESVIKSTKTVISQKATGGMSPFSSHPAHAGKSMSMGMCTVNRKQCEAKTGVVEHPTPVAINLSSKPTCLVSKEKSGLKRSPREIINLDCNTVIPNKVSKRTLSPIREGNSGIRITQAITLNPSAASSGSITSRIAHGENTLLHPGSMEAPIPPRASDDRMQSTLQLSKTMPLRRTSDSNCVQEVAAAVKQEPRENCIRSSSSSKPVDEKVCLNQQRTPTSKSVSMPISTAPQVRPSPILINKESVVSQLFSKPRTLNKSTPNIVSVKSNPTNPKISSWGPNLSCNDSAGGNKEFEPEGFPVISSVFSLSEQQGGVQGPNQPLVMALRGIVMNKKQSLECKTEDHIEIINTEKFCEAPTIKRCDQEDTKNGFLSHQTSVTELVNQSIKAEDQDKAVPHPPALTQMNSLVKEEITDVKTQSSVISSLSSSERSTCEETETAPCVDKIIPCEQVSPPADPPRLEMNKIQDVVSSKFLSISLKRVQVGMWRKRKKGLKLRTSGDKTDTSGGPVTDNTLISLMPLKGDQLVQQPGPNQPVVVLNHPNPRAFPNTTTTDTLDEMSTSEGLPKCQILKMRLSKVMGKYEVMGCTVGFSL